MTHPTPASERARAATVAATCACFNLRRTARAITQLYDDALRETGLRCTQFSLLSFLSGFGSARITRLAQAAGMDYTTLVRNVNLLERDGLIRSRAAEDGRVREVSLTESGRRALAAAVPRWEAAQARVTKAVGAERLGRMLQDLSATAAAVHSA
jgi:DNA-binding MarR family transcriptional regulator